MLVDGGGGGGDKCIYYLLLFALSTYSSPCADEMGYKTAIYVYQF
jgi:hypothetical protein